MERDAPANEHFASATDWRAARELLAFIPRPPAYTAGQQLQGLRVFVMDHRRRDVPVGERTLEAHYGSFVVSQSQHTKEEARRKALEVGYGREAQPASVRGREARMYALGPEPEPDDPDGREPAVVTWSDGRMFYLVASGELEVGTLLRIAESLYR